MKKNEFLRAAMLALVVLSSHCAAMAQNLDDLVKGLGREVLGQAVSGAAARQEKVELGKAAAQFNADQPATPLRGRTVEVRLGEETRRGWWGDRDEAAWLRSELTRLFTAVGARPVWGLDGILGESRERDALGGNRWVDQRTIAGEGTIQVAEFVAEVDWIRLEKSSDLRAALGSWSRRVEVDFSRETSYFLLALTLRSKGSGEVLAVYKTVGTASSADNVGGNIVGGFLNSAGAGFRSRGDSREDRDNRARENALRQMAEVLRAKTN